MFSELNDTIRDHAADLTKLSEWPFDPLSTSLALSPTIRQLSGCSGGEDGLAEAFEDVGHAVEAFAAGIHPSQDRVELVGDAPLFVQGSEGHLKAPHILRLNCRVKSALDGLGHAL
jgi:hypothetical protein